MLYVFQMTDQLFGACLLAATGLAFTYYTLLVVVMPFVDEDQDYIHALFPDRKFAVALPLLAGVIGLLAIGCFVSVVLLKSGSKQKTS
ncbi:dolichol phosphate-mannose biosynthesis regulatory protein-like [Mercenaria mercenaria]|uniref:dolichol phosphate-mannose biosynthesis regulatory protein-like n=1 Tax=Mercenaria mercenaria TaxID=6596 RepID=UPI00234EFD08|nr:dolichol phosphate-mannose biosynthesis regulatory protein-like [Mercenaria mercenaria]